MSTDSSNPRIFSDKQHDDMYRTLEDLERKVFEITIKKVQSEAEAKLLSAKLTWEKSLAMSCLARAHTLLAQVEVEIAATQLTTDLENEKRKAPESKGGTKKEQNPGPKKEMRPKNTGPKKENIKNEEIGPVLKEAKGMCNQNLNTIYERPYSSSHGGFTEPRRHSNIERSCTRFPRAETTYAEKTATQTPRTQNLSGQKRSLSRKTVRTDSPFQPKYDEDAGIIRLE